MISAAAVATGRSHRLFAHNCQDSAVAGQPAPGCAFGFVFDGCGSRFHDGAADHPSRNETGAHLMAHFSAGWLGARLRPETQLAQLATALDAALVAYLTRITDQTAGADSAARRTFIATHLLATTVGFLATPAEQAFVSAGDGFLLRDGFVCELGADNRPSYLAYRLLADPPHPTLEFHLLPIRATRLAVASDGWRAPQLAELAAPRPARQLQRRLNQLAQDRAFFSDDAAAAACWYDAPAGEST